MRIHRIDEYELEFHLPVFVFVFIKMKMSILTTNPVNLFYLIILFLRYGFKN